MIEQLLSKLHQECNYHPGDNLLLGVSGGADSLALLHGLHSLKIPMITAHLDHGLRPESGEDCQFVKQFSEVLGVPFVSKRSDVKKYAEDQKLSIEEAGRELRYHFLFDQAVKKKAAAVVVAHTADDHVETILMHLLRGAGLEGLSGMNYSTITPWHESIPLFRPLLNIWREEIDEYCSSMGIKPLNDQSNLDVSFYRNRIRHELIPNLAQYNPGIKTALWKTAMTLQADWEILEKIVLDHYQGVVDEAYDTGLIIYQRDDFLALHRGIQRRLIRTGIQRLHPELRDIGFNEVEKVIGFVNDPPRSGEADLFRGLHLRVEKNRFMIIPQNLTVMEKEIPQLSAEEPLSLPVPGVVAISENWEIRTEKIELTKSMLDEVQGNQDHMTAYVDLGNISLPFLIRGRVPGEYFHPLGMGGKRIKISDFLINEKMPKWQRDDWPMVYAGDELIWIPGYRIGDQVRVTTDSVHVVKLTLKKTAK